MPTPTVAPPAASRIAFDFTARQARQAKARSASASSAAASPEASVQVGGVVALGVDRSRSCSSRPPEIGAELDRRRAQRRALEDPDVLLRLQDLERAVLVAGRDDDLGEDLGDLLGHLDRHRQVRRDDAAERRHRVARVRLAVGVGDVGADRDAARVGVLDDRDGRLVEVVRRTPGGVGVDVVVVGHLLAVQLLGLREPGPPGRKPLV